MYTLHKSQYKIKRYLNFYLCIINVDYGLKKDKITRQYNEM